MKTPDPLWGVIERIGASGIHIGFTLIIAQFLWMAPVLAAIHSLTNLAATRLVRWNVAATEAVVTALALAVGLLVSGVV